MVMRTDSIHPYTPRGVSNTCKRAKDGVMRGKYKKKMNRLNARIRDWDATQSNLKQTNRTKPINPLSFKKPGSQKTHG